MYDMFVPQYVAGMLEGSAQDATRPESELRARGDSTVSQAALGGDPHRLLWQRCIHHHTPDVPAASAVLGLAPVDPAAGLH